MRHWTVQLQHTCVADGVHVVLHSVQESASSAELHLNDAKRRQENREKKEQLTRQKMALKAADERAELQRHVGHGCVPKLWSICPCASVSQFVF